MMVMTVAAEGGRCPGCNGKHRMKLSSAGKGFQVSHEKTSWQVDASVREGVVR